MGGWNNGLAKDWPPAYLGPAEPKVMLKTRDTEQVHFCAVAAGESLGGLPRPAGDAQWAPSCWRQSQSFDWHSGHQYVPRPS